MGVRLPVDPEDGNEGVMAAQFGDTHMPLIAADRERLAMLWPIAVAGAKRHGIKVRLVWLTQREVVVDDVLQAPLPAELPG